MTKFLDLTIRVLDDEFEVDVYEPESGELTTMRHPLSFDEHPEFDKAIGEAIYEWLHIWKGEQNEVSD